MKTKSRKIPGIIFTGFLVLLFFVWLGSFLNFKSSLDNLIPRLEFNGEEALASENDIEKALERIRTDQYGVCERCGKNIILTRLQAVPHAMLCVRCQRRAETTFNISGASASWPRVDTSN